MELRELNAHFNYLKTDRNHWEPIYNQLTRYFTPPSNHFHNTGYRTDGVLPNPTTYSDVPSWAANTLAAALMGMVINPMNKWLQFDVMTYLNDPSEESLIYLQTIRDMLMHFMFLPEVGMYDKFHQTLLEYVIFGEGMIMITPDPKKTKLFKITTVPLKELYYILNDDNEPDIVFRECKRTLISIARDFPESLDDTLRERLERNPFEEYTVIHAVFERDTPGFSKFSKKKRYASIHYMEYNGLTMLRESGFDKFPYVNFVWQRFSGETRGRGPGVFSLRACSLLNQIIRDSLKASQKMISPPKILNRRGWLGKINDYPDGIMYADGHDMDNMYREFGTTGQPVLGREWSRDFIEQINRVFYLDKIKAPQKAAEVKEAEVMVNEEERMRELVPQMSNMFKSISQMVELMFHYSKKFMPEPPEELIGQGVQIKFVSPLARAQKSMELAATQRTLQQFVMPWANIAPDTIKAINTPELIRYTFAMSDIPRTVVNSREKIEQQKQQEQQAIQMQQGMEQANGMMDLVGKMKDSEIDPEALMAQFGGG